ncbi:YndM family protein [Bacillus sp. 31A1R]|uniref:YndM family protein n=1 Tax=Robertmurraya mangrovi TaxID=3098077 RepID=A0ABU5J383_9BACI|nr:YndM family protein [Bacillus sp. 31A1R]MDZ5473879.1 YndM family protein [Bacillus sp. 31A1R]
MPHLRAITIKLISTLIALYIVLGLFYGMTFGNVLMISLLLGVIAYIVGDSLILPRTNNVIATVADFGLAFAVIWFIGSGVIYRGNLFTMALTAAIGVAILEYFFHQYLMKTILSNQNRTNLQSNLQLQTELSEELTPVRPDVRSNREDEL